MPQPTRRYVRPKQAAAYTGIPESSLAKKRLRGDEPPYTKIGAAVFYDLEVLDALMASRRRRSTSDACPARPAIPGDVRDAIDVLLRGYGDVLTGDERITLHRLDATEALAGTDRLKLVSIVGAVQMRVGRGNRHGR